MCYIKNLFQKKLLFIVLLLEITVASAQEKPNEFREPPKEAITICQSKSEGESCSMTTPQGDTLNGTCKNTPDGKYFVCMPSDMGQHKRPHER